MYNEPSQVHCIIQDGRIHLCSKGHTYVNELGKRDIMRVLSSILSILHNEFNRFNDTGARILGSILSYKPITTLNTLRFCHINMTLLRPSMHNVTKTVNH